MDAIVGKDLAVTDFAVKQDPEGQYGPWLIGLMGVTLLAGIITAQATRFFSTFGTENRGIFAVVALSLVLTIAQWIVLIDAAWSWFVLHFGDYRALASTRWQFWTTPLSQGIVTTSQLFFVYRCYSLYHRKKIILIGILLGMLGGITLVVLVATLTATNPFNYSGSRLITTLSICVTLVTDFSITGLTLWKLGMGGGESYSANTNDVLRRLRNLTVEAAVPPALSALAHLTVYLVCGKRDFAFVAFGVVTPSLYVCSMLFTLNSRRAIRRVFNNQNHSISLNGGFELSNFVASGRRARQTESRRTTIVFAPATGPSLAPNASIGIVHERVEGSQDKPAVYRGRGSGSEDDDDDDDKTPTTPSASHKELQVDLEKWGTHGLIPSRSRSTLRHPDRIPEPPAVATLQTGNGEYKNG